MAALGTCPLPRHRNNTVRERLPYDVSPTHSSQLLRHNHDEGDDDDYDDDDDDDDDDVTTTTATTTATTQRHLRTCTCNTSGARYRHD
jgi:hypothetical protein